MSKITSDVKITLERDIMQSVPELAKKIGIQYKSYLKCDVDKSLFHMNDKEKTYLSTPNYQLLGSVDGVDIADDTTITVSATLIKDDTLTINHVEFSFEHSDDVVLKKLIDKNKLTEVFANYHEIETFILNRSAIIESITPTVRFNIEGELTQISINFEYKKTKSIFPSDSERYYTSTLDLYNVGINPYYGIETAYDSLIFSKMAFISIMNTDALEIFQCEDWVELYNLFRKDPTSFLSLYDMTTF